MFENRQSEMEQMLKSNTEFRAIYNRHQELDKQVNGLSAVVEKIFEVENPDAMFGVFAFRKENQTLIVGRSQRELIDLNELLEVFGGGGHTSAAGFQIESTLVALKTKIIELAEDL